MANNIASDNGDLLHMLGEIHYDQAKRLGDYPDPCEDIVQKGIMTARSNNEILSEILFYLNCKDDNEYTAVKKYDLERKSYFMNEQTGNAKQTEESA